MITTILGAHQRLKQHVVAFVLMGFIAFTLDTSTKKSPTKSRHAVSVPSTSVAVLPRTGELHCLIYSVDLSMSSVEFCTAPCVIIFMCNHDVLIVCVQGRVSTTH